MQAVRKARRVFRSSGDNANGKEEARRLSGSGLEEGMGGAQNPFSLANSAIRIQQSWRIHKLMHELAGGNDHDKLVRMSMTLRSTMRSAFDGKPPDTRQEAWEQADAAHAKMQRREVQGRRMSEALGVAPPMIEVARINTAARMARQGPNDEKPGKLYPLDCHLTSFDTFGADISQYMFFLHRALRVFTTIFLINLSNIVISWEGAQLHQAGSIFTWHTLGNLGPDGVLARGGHSFVVVEVVCMYILVGFLFHMRYKLAQIRRRVRHAESRQLRAVDFSVMVSGVPPNWGAREVRAHFEPHGEVVHVGLSLDYRDLVFALEAEREAQDDLEDACIHLAHTIADAQQDDAAPGGGAARTSRRGGAASAAAAAASGGAPPPKQVTRARAAARGAMEAKAGARRRVARLVKRRYVCTGHAFVTFNRFDDAHRLRHARYAHPGATLNGGGGERVGASVGASTAAGSVSGGGGGGGGGAMLPRTRTAQFLDRIARSGPGGSVRGSVHGEGGVRLKIEEAPAAAAVLWHNLGTSRRERRIRTGLTYAVLGVLCILGTAILLGTNIFNQGWTLWLDVQERPLGVSLALWLGSTLLIVAGHLLFIVTTPLLVTHLERPRSHDELERSIVVKLSFFQWFNNVLTAFTLLWVPTPFNPHPSGMFDSSWYPTGAALIFNAMLGDLTVICWGIDFVRPGDLIRRRWLAPRAKTQAKANELHAVEAEITLAFRVQLMNKFLLLGLTFSFAMPALYLFILLYMWSAQWVDRVNFLRRLVPPPPTNGGQMRLVVDYVLPLAIALHVGMAVRFFFDICNQDPFSYALGILGGGGDDELLEAVRNTSLATCSRLFADAFADGAASVEGSAAAAPSPVGLAPMCTDDIDAMLGNATCNGTAPCTRVALACYLTEGDSACEVTHGLEQTCASRGFLSAKLWLLLSMLFWLMWLGFYFYLGHSRRGKASQLSERMFRIKLIWRFVTQRDFLVTHGAAAREAPRDPRAGATIRGELEDQTAASTAIDPSSALVPIGEAADEDASAQRRVRGLADGCSRDDDDATPAPGHRRGVGGPPHTHTRAASSRDSHGPPTLLESTLFYVPPLTRLLLISNLRESSNRHCGAAGDLRAFGLGGQAQLDEMEQSSVLFGMDL